jgi:hypothetical protein
MLGPCDYLLVVLSFALEAAVIFGALYRRVFVRHLAVNLYMLIAVTAQVGGFVCLERYGLRSDQYFFFYYYMDSVLTMAMFFVILHFYQEILTQLNIGRYIRGGATLLLVATAGYSYFMVHQSYSQSMHRFVVEFGQNTYFLGVVLTYLLWGAMLKLRQARKELVQMILALGIYFSGIAAAYAARNLFPGLQDSLLHWLPPVMGTWLPLAWAYALLKVKAPSEAHSLAAPLPLGAQ